MALTQVTPDVVHNIQSNITQVGTLSNLTVTNTIVGNINGNANNSSYLGGTAAASYALGSAVTTANTAMKGYVDGQISTTTSAITTANTAMKGYVDAVTTAWTANAGAQAGSIATLTANAATQSGLIASKANSSDTLYVGTTAIALNRTSASQSLTGVNIDGSASYASSAGSATTATTANNALNLGGTPAANYLLTSGTVVTAPAGATVNFTGIPSWVKRIAVMFSGVSLSASVYPILRLGTSAGVSTTGYLGAAQFCTNSGIAGIALTTGFVIYDNSPSLSDLHNGTITFTLLDSATNTWTASGVITRSNNITTSWIAGSVELAGTLDRVQLTTVAGTATVDAGTINIIYD